MRQWLDTWRRVGLPLEQERVDKMRALTDADGLLAMKHFLRKLPAAARLPRLVRAARGLLAFFDEHVRPFEKAWTDAGLTG